MRTLNLDEASSFLKLPKDDIRLKVNVGELPGAQLNDDIVFIEMDLANYIRGKYTLTEVSNTNKLNPVENKSVSESDKVLFKDLVPHIIRTEELRVMRGELSKKSLQIIGNRLTKWIAPYFNDMAIIDIDYKILEIFINNLFESEINGSAISQYLIIIRKVLNYALYTNIINRLPLFPRVTANRTSRGGFTIQEYRKLLKTAWKLRDQPYMMKSRPRLVSVSEIMQNEVYMPRDMTRLIGFMVNSFIRPSDLKFIQHKHVKIIEGKYNYLRLTLPETKKHDQQIVTMTACVGIYKRLLKDAKERGYGKPNDYLFMPEFRQNRDHALRHMGFLFKWILKLSNLEYGAKGQTRTLYCLRHASITYRLLYGEGVDLLTLAKNARTSVSMIEKHYASTLNGEMNIALLHSKRTKKRN